MNTGNSVSPEQIAALFRAHGLARDPAVARMTAGFTNAVCAVDGYILKVCVLDGADRPAWACPAGG